VLFLAFVRYQQNHRQVCNSGLDVCAGELDILKFDKKSTDFGISHFNLVGRGALFGG